MISETLVKRDNDRWIDYKKSYMLNPTNIWYPMYIAQCMAIILCHWPFDLPDTTQTAWQLNFPWEVACSYNYEHTRLFIEVGKFWLLVKSLQFSLVYTCWTNVSPHFTIFL